MIKIAVVENDRPARLSLCSLLESCLISLGEEHMVSSFISGEELLNDPQPFLMFFLDIGLPGLSGIETAKLLRERGETGFIIFTTALPEYVYDSFEVEAFDYLIKPVDEVRLSRTVDRALKKGANGGISGLLIFKKGSGHQLIPFSDIMYCEAVNHRLELHTKDGAQSCYMRIEEVGRKLDSRFFRCHRSYFINLEYVSGYANSQAVLKSGEKIPVSRLRSQEFMKAMLLFMKGKSGV